MSSSPQQKTALLVLGMHRSGTSALTRVLSLLGADLPSNMIEPGDDNRSGFWEARRLLQIHDEILQSLGLTWDDTGIVDPAWHLSSAGLAFKDRLLAHLRSEFADSPLFVLKDPRMCRLVPLWRETLADFGACIKAVIVFRNPLDVAASLRARNDFDENASSLLWLRHVLDAEWQTRGLQRSFMSFEDLLTDWRNVLENLSPQLDIEWPNDIAGIVGASIQDYLSVDLYHHRSSATDLQNSAIVADWVREAYPALLILARNENHSDAATTLDRIRADLDQATAAFGPIIAAARVRGEQQQQRLNETETAARMHQEKNQQRLDEYRTALADVNKTLAENEIHIASLSGQLLRLHRSRSWRITGPLRYLKRTVIGPAISETDCFNNTTSPATTDNDSSERSRSSFRERTVSWTLKRLWLPLPDSERLRARLFRQFPGLFHNSDAYRRWAGTVEAMEMLFDPNMYFRRQRQWIAARDTARAEAENNNLVAAEFGACIDARRDRRFAENEHLIELRQIRALRRLIEVDDETPRVSIVVPVFNNVCFTVDCIKSVLAWPSKFSYEIILVDDGSIDATAECFGTCESIHYLRNAHNLGFLRSVNHGAEQAQGEYIVILNNDTVVWPNWLDRLIDTFTDFPTAGLVGSKLVYPDGRLQEAGSIIWEDASGHNVGRGTDPNHPRFNYLREVDYASGASIALPRALWQTLGGFDERFVPAYYEDTDLAFRVRELGRRVLYQPLSVAFHHEGISSGRSLHAGVKRHQAINQHKFFVRWESTIAKHGSAGNATGCADRTATCRMLVIDALTPTPDCDSGSADCFEFLRIFKDFGLHVTFVPENLDHMGRHTADLQRLGIHCLYKPYVQSLADAVRQVADQVDVVLLYRAPVAHAIIDTVRRYAPRAKIIFDTVDLHFLRLEREAAVLNSTSLRESARKTRGIELAVMQKSDATIVLSHFEMDLVKKLTPNVTCHRIPIVREIPGRNDTPWERRKDILFLGGYQHSPNVDAAIFLVTEVWPRVRALNLGARLILAGSKMPPEIHSLGADDVVIEGFIANLPTTFAALRLSVAPLRYGAGLKGKVVTSLSFGVPCVASKIAIEGSEFRSEIHVLVGDDPESMAQQIGRAYSDRELWHRLSDNGLKVCRDTYSIDMVTPQLAQLLQSLSIDVPNPVPYKN